MKQCICVGLILLVGGMIVGTQHGSANMQDAKGGTVGKYQITTCPMPKGNALFMVDTSTGQVWTTLVPANSDALGAGRLQFNKWQEYAPAKQ